MSNIYSMLNRQLNLADMRCLNEITSKDKLKTAEYRGYLFGFTVRTWAKRFPGINPKYVYCTRQHALPSELYYYDPDRYICFALRIYNGDVIELGGKPYAETLLEEIEAKRRLSEQKSYLKLLLPVASEQSGNIAMEVLRLMLEREDPNPELYEAAISTYTLCDCGAQVLGETAIRRLAQCKSDAQRAATAAALADFPEEFIVYRGEGSESTPHEKACSWTTDEGRAYFFAGWRSDKGCRVYRGTIRKEDVIEFVNDRGESEIITVPGAVKNARSTETFSLDMFLDLIGPQGLAKGYVFPDSSAPTAIRDNIREIYRRPESVTDHDWHHPLRVALLASFLFRCCVLIPAYEQGDRKKFQNACRIYKRLLLAAGYHDSGRTDNLPGEDHGRSGYERFCAAHGEDRTVELLTVYHCRNDEDTRSFWEENCKGPDSSLIWKAFETLKDADALDRVRFGFSSEDSLDVSTLHLSESKQLIPAAMALVKANLD